MTIYFDDFAATANPIGGIWTPGRNTSRAQVLTTGGNAFGTGTNNDGYAYVAGAGDCVIESTVFRDASLSDTEPTSYEFEHLLRVTDGTGFTNAYEADCAYGGGFNLVRWSSATSFAVLTTLVTDTNFFPDGAGGQWRNGYRFKTEIVAGVLNIYADSGSGYVKYFHYVLGSDTTNDAVPLASGDPAIAFFTTNASSNLFGFQDTTLTNGVATPGRIIQSTRVTSRNVGAAAQRFYYRMPQQIWGGVVLDPPGQTVVAVRIANPRVGPIALRQTFGRFRFQWLVSGGGPTVFTQALTAASSFIGNFIKVTSKGLAAAALSFIGNFVKATSKGLAAAALSFSGAFVKQTSALKTAALSFVGAQTRAVAKKMTAALSFVGTFIKATSKQMTAALPFVGVQARAVSKFMTAVLPFIGNLVGGHLFAKALTATLSFIGGFVSIKLLLKVLTAALSFSGTFVKSTNKSMTAAVNFVGSSLRQIAKQMTATAGFVGVYVARTAKQLSAGALSFVGNTTKQVNKFTTAALSFIGAVTGGRVFLKVLAAALSFVGTMSRLPNKTLTAALSFSGAVSTGKRLFGKVWIAARRAVRWSIGQR